jgi:hypothetical protein
MAKTISDLYSTSQMTLPGVPNDPINLPEHYCKGSIQPLDVFKDWSKDEDPLLFFYKTQIIKYLRREKYKGKLSDLKKAQFYLNELVRQGEIYYGS